MDYIRNVFFPVSKMCGTFLATLWTVFGESENKCQDMSKTCLKYKSDQVPREELIYRNVLFDESGKHGHGQTKKYETAGNIENKST